MGDMLLPYACASGAEGEEPIPGAGAPFVPEGSPLLPNLGKANVHGYLIDIMVRLTVYLVQGMKAALTERASR